MKNMVRFGVIGTSRITEEFINSVRLNDGCCVNAVYSRTEEQGRLFAHKHSVKNIFASLQDMAQSNLIDAIYIASPNSFHASQAVSLMSHGKHVLCEKPIASNCKELSAMVEAARKNRVLLMEAIKTTFLPNFQAIQQNLHKIGKVRRFFLNYCQYSSRYDQYKAGNILNAFNPALSNGSIMDIGIYCIYPAVYLFGKPDNVSANAIMLESGIDGGGSITLHYKDMEVIISHSKITNSTLPSEIQGEDGVMIIDKISIPQNVKVTYRDGSYEDIQREQFNDSMYYEVQEFIALIKNGKVESNINSLQLSLDVMEIMDNSRQQIGLRFSADL
jgi:predicted dehydrogenase